MTTANTGEITAFLCRIEQGDAASDINSLGLVAYEILTVRCAIRDESPTEIISKHLAGWLHPPSQL